MRSFVFCLLLAVAAGAQTIEVPNPSFETGREAPDGWTLSGGQGTWLTEGADGQRAIAVTGTGTGESTNFWRSHALALQPNALYRLRFRVRSLGGSGGTPVTGPVFANNDLGGVPATWTWTTQVFATPRSLSPENAWLRFGQWSMKGAVAFDQLSLTGAQPLYATTGDLELGDGERVSGHKYTFQAPLGARSGNHSRPLDGHDCGFNTSRWVFGAGSQVAYRHQLGQRQQTAAKVAVTIGWYRGGQLEVEASRDGVTYTALGTLGELGAGSWEVPAALLPARQIWVRLVAQAKEKVGEKSDPGSFQVHAYSYEATFDGAPAELDGQTRYVAITQADPRLNVRLVGFGEGLPGGVNEVQATVTNATGQPVTMNPTVTVVPAGAPLPAADGPAQTLAPGEQPLRLPYELAGPGAYDLVVRLGNYRAETTVQVAGLYNASYGEAVPGSTRDVALWWCESGWKVSQQRPAPARTGAGVRIAAARRETDAAQLVLRPTRPLTGLTVTPGALRAATGNGAIPAGSVEVLRVRYVPVTRPTDKTGAVAPWPDPLPPLRAPLDLAAGANQPLWIRVNVPAGTAAGEYRGQLALSAAGWRAEVPLLVTVFDFDLPERMSLVTAFGLSAGEAFRYQKVTDPAQRREVWDRYLRAFSAHHISPYDPAQLDPFRVTWPGLGSWDGGLRDTVEKHGGVSALKLVDESPTSTASSGYGEAIPIRPGGLRLTFWYRTAQAGQQVLVTLNHHDAGGQWMSGRNNDQRLTGTGQWQLYDQTITTFPPGATSARLTLRPCLWADDGHTTGTAWFDDLRVQDAATGEDLVQGGDFEPIGANALVPRIDWSAWDRAMTRAIDELKFNSFRMPIQGLGGGTFHSRVDPSLLGFAEGTPQYQTAMRNYLGQVEQHLAEKGWLDEAYVYWFDEPDPKDYAFVLNGFNKLKRYAPRLPRMLTEQPEPELVGGPNIWCPVSSSYEAEAAQERMKAGDVFWWYVCTGPKEPYATLFIDHPGTELRVWCWQTWQRDIRGILVWASNYWTSGAAYPDPARPQNPYEDPMGWVSGYDTPAGTKAAWGNGDGRFVYPPEAAADANPPAPVIDGPVDSIRFEMLRDGIEDYEYLTILRGLLQSKQGRLTAADRARYEELLRVPTTITATMTEFTTDPAPLEQRRSAIAAAIAELQRR